MKPIALIFDPIFDNIRTKGISEIISEMGMKSLQFSFQFAQTNPKKFIDEFEKSIQDAEIIFFLGQYFWFQYYDSQSEKINNLLEEKLKIGTPMYLEIPRIFQKINNPYGKNFTYNINIRKFLKSLGIIPTENKIFSKYDYHLDHDSGSSIWIRKSDECIINQLLKETNEFVISGSNEMEILTENNTFPLVQAPSTSFLIDSMDNLVRPRLGRRSCIAASHQSESANAIIFSGSVLTDPVDTLMGVIHGIDVNHELARNIINYLQSERDRIKPIVFRKFDQIERLVGDFITNIIFDNKSDNEIIKLIPEKNFRSMYSQNYFDFSAAYYDDLIDIILYNWNFIENRFNISKSKFREIFKSINYSIRRNLAHPHRAKFDKNDFGLKDIEKLDHAITLISRAMDIL